MHEESEIALSIRSDITLRNTKDLILKKHLRYFGTAGNTLKRKENTFFITYRKRKTTWKSQLRHNEYTIF